MRVRASDAWETTERKYGVWINRKTKKIAIAKDIDGDKWTIDKGVLKRHPILKIKQSIYAEGNGNYFFHRELQRYEFLRSDITGFTPGKIHE